MGIDAGVQAFKANAGLSLQESALSDFLNQASLCHIDLETIDLGFRLVAVATIRKEILIPGGNKTDAI
jgi:hypothetical protein